MDTSFDKQQQAVSKTLEERRQADEKAAEELRQADAKAQSERVAAEQKNAQTAFEQRKEASQAAYVARQELKAEQHEQPQQSQPQHDVPDLQSAWEQGLDEKKDAVEKDDSKALGRDSNYLDARINPTLNPHINPRIVPEGAKPVHIENQVVAAGSARSAHREEQQQQTELAATPSVPESRESTQGQVATHDPVQTLDQQQLQHAGQVQQPSRMDRQAKAEVGQVPTQSVQSTSQPALTAQAQRTEAAAASTPEKSVTTLGTTQPVSARATSQKLEVASRRPGESIRQRNERQAEMNLAAGRDDAGAHDTTDSTFADDFASLDAPVTSVATAGNASKRAEIEDLAQPEPIPLAAQILRVEPTEGPPDAGGEDPLGGLAGLLDSIRNV